MVGDGAGHPYLSMGGEDFSYFINEKPENGFFDRSKNEPYEFEPGIMRYDMVGDFSGAISSYFSELNFDPGSDAPNHYHPNHE